MTRCLAAKRTAAFDAFPATHENADVPFDLRTPSELFCVQNDLVASFVFGAGLILLGAWLIRWHLRTWHAHRNDGTLNEGERAHYRAQVRRRIHISFLLILLGIIIPAWDFLTTRRFLSEQAALLGIIVMLLVALWIMVLAMLDWLSTRIRRRAMLGALASLARKKRELEDEVARLRQQQRNGRG